MSLQVFECDTCKRTIEKTFDKYTVDNFGRCNISDGCKGILRKVQMKKGYNTPSVPAPSQLEDWAQRKILANHTQQLPNTSWFIKHKLNNHPDVYCYYYDENKELQIVEPTSISYTDNDNMIVSFDQAYYGIAQCVSKTTPLTTSVTTSTSTQNFVPLSINGKIVIGLASILSNKKIGFNFKSPLKTAFETRIEYSTTDDTLTSPSTSSIWFNGDGYRVVVNGKEYTVYELDISTIFENTSIINGSVGYVDHTSSSLFNEREAVFLISNSPYTSSSDRNLTKYGITYTMTASTAASCLLVDDGEIKINTALLKSTYPPIIIS